MNGKENINGAQSDPAINCIDCKISLEPADAVKLFGDGGEYRCCRCAIVALRNDIERELMMLELVGFVALIMICLGFACN